MNIDTLSTEDKVKLANLLTLELSHKQHEHKASLVTTVLVMFMLLAIVGGSFSFIAFNELQTNYKQTVAELDEMSMGMNQYVEATSVELADLRQRLQSQKVEVEKAKGVTAEKTAKLSQAHAVITQHRSSPVTTSLYQDTVRFYSEAIESFMED